MTYESFRMLVILRACIWTTNRHLPFHLQQRMPALRLGGVFAEGR